MTLSIYSADALAPLADQLSKRLGSPLPDPMMPELVAVPSVGMQRWLRLHLADTLGASPGSCDGIAANIQMPFPGILRSQLFTADLGDQEDPWRLGPLTFAVHHVLVQEIGNEQLGSVTELPLGATWYGRARRIADLFDRYGTRRPEMLRSWAEGQDLDPTGETLRFDFRWQPALFRLVRQHIGTASPAERLPALLAALKANSLRLDLPPRFSIFGVSTLPGGQAFADLLKAFGEHRDVDLFMVDPALATTQRLNDGFGDVRELKRQEDLSAAEVRQPLLRSWGRASRESQLLLSRLNLPAPQQLRSDVSPTKDTMLGQLQAHLRGDRAPSAQYVPSEQDCTIEIHACTGIGRQVEVLRDALLAELRDDPTLNESDILVVCPDLASFAPLIPGELGPSAERAAADWGGLPRLRYTISDRDLPNEDALNGAILALVGLVSGRYPASHMLDFLSLPPVADAFMMDSDDLAQVERWLDITEIRWGLNEENRRRHDLPGLHTNTWKHGLNQLLVGMAINDDDLVLGPGEVPAAGVEGGGVATLNRLLAFVARLETIDAEWSRPDTIDVWNQRLSEAVTELFQMPFQEAWQIERARTAIAGVLADAQIARADAPVFSLPEIAELLGERLQSRSARPKFFDGAITFTSLRPLRWVPHRIIAILGLDEAAMAKPRVNGDDILGSKPDIGDPDQRADQRQALLETVLSARDKLIVTRSGKDVRSNKAAPPSIAVAELLSEIEAITAVADRQSVLQRIRATHPRHSFDPQNFSHLPPLSFDRRALLAAEAKVASRKPTILPPLPQLLVPPDRERLTDVKLLHDILQDGPKLFFSQRLGATFRQTDEGLEDNIPVRKDNLLMWSVLDDLITSGLLNKDLGPRLDVLRRRGSFPPGPSGAEILDLQRKIAEAVVKELAELQGASATETLSIELDHQRLCLRGQIARVDQGRRIGPIRASASAIDQRFTRRLWLDLCLLTAAHPHQQWTAVGVTKADSGKIKKKDFTTSMRMRMRGESPQERRDFAIFALEQISDLAELGMREPLPVFAKVEPKKEPGSLLRWADRFGMSTNSYARAAFGALSDAQLLQLPARPTDPGDPNEQSRFLRLHHYLTGLISDTTEVFT
ncbi:MAG: exodeoxyribonuclease V subunit gamma [Acidimicrobiales bacterium]|nr:exodeoxyribonuclease V subunit gamma [Acidimicrobiales bacterium]